MSQHLLDYNLMLQEALRGVVRSSLETVAEHGLPGEHHFYLTFRTEAAGVILPPQLRERYPEEMTIVLKTQYKDLAVGDDGFSVGLYFDGVLHYLTVPFAALTVFVDPAVGFQLTFQPGPDGEGEEAEIVAGLEAVPEDVEDADEEEGGDEDAAVEDNVVSFESFRKKR